MTIVFAPDPRLLVKCSAVDKVTPELVDIAQDMYRIMRNANGIGLAANQVGLTMRIVVFEDNGPLLMFNPVILKRSNETEYNHEGCLSFPNLFRLIKRSLEVTVKYRDEFGKMQYYVCKGLLARAVLHEIDHLDGKLFVDLPEKLS